MAKKIPIFFLVVLTFLLPSFVYPQQLYRNNLKNREFGKEALLNSDSERATIARGQGANENPNSEKKPTSPETDSSSYFGISEEEAEKIGVDLYIYGYPLVTMELTRRVLTNVASPKGSMAPMGQFANSRTYPDPSFRAITAPNADTLYSTAWIDVSKEPYILHVPEEEGRYYLMPMLCGWSEVFADPGTRTSGTKAQDFAITGPNFSGVLPKGMKELKSPTNLVWIVGRTYCTGEREDYKKVHAIQDLYSLTPLSSYGKPYTPPVGSVDPNIDMKTPVRNQVHNLSAAEYFQLLSQLMKKNPPTSDDAPMIGKMKKIQFFPGKDYLLENQESAIANALAKVPKIAQEKIMAHMASSGTMVNGWLITLRTGRYGTDYLQRAFLAATGLGSNLPQDAVYPLTQTDSEGSPLSGKNRYVLHFLKGETPPARAFWSLTLYNEQYFFVPNPLNRFTLSPRNDLKYNDDGSLDLYIQNASPGKDKESNWLPAPSGRFLLMLRLYWPEKALLKGIWKPPAVQKINEERR